MYRPIVSCVTTNVGSQINNQSTQAEKNSVAKEEKQPLSTSSAPSTYRSSISHLYTVDMSSPDYVPLFCPATLRPGLLPATGSPEASVTRTSQASPEAQGKSSARNSQVTFSSSTPTPMGQPSAAVQEDRVSRDAHTSSDALPLPTGQVRPAVQDLEDAHDAHESRGGSAAPTGQDTSSVPAVQELATPHGEELALDGLDAEAGEPAGPQTEAPNVVENEHVDVTAPAQKIKWPRHLLTDKQKDNLMWVSTIRYS